MGTAAVQNSLPGATPCLGVTPCESPQNCAPSTLRRLSRCVIPQTQTSPFYGGNRSRDGEEIQVQHRQPAPESLLLTDDPPTPKRAQEHPEGKEADFSQGQSAAVSRGETQALGGLVTGSLQLAQGSGQWDRAQQVGSAHSQASQDRRKPESTRFPASHQHTSCQTGPRPHAPAALGTVGTVTWALECEHSGPEGCSGDADWGAGEEPGGGVHPCTPHTLTPHPCTAR